MHSRLRIQYVAAGLAAALLFPLMAVAVEPTSIEPAEPVVPNAIELEQGIQYLHLHGDYFESETELSYGINKYLELGISVPVSFEEGEDADLEDIGLFIEGVFNPDSESTMVGGELRMDFPTGEDSDGIGGEAQLRITHPFGPDQKHALHLNLTGLYGTVEEDRHGWWHSDESTDRDFRFAAALGYSCDIAEATTLMLALSHEQDYEESDDANLIELGISHDFSPACTVGLGVGTGLDSDSPDFEAKAIFQLHFKMGK
jgi:hypothetical protein